ncbi:MAG TPA: D-glycerate dehydrogenase [Burkholderiales bacterium]|nr:D-glycerate dehydrogenase [Burkholderiales bacterium]
MKPKIAVTREVFDDTLTYLAGYFEVVSNQSDRPYAPEQLARELADKDGALTTIADRIDSALLDRCPQLKAVCNIAVGYNNIDIAACDARGVVVTNTPGVLDDATADFTWTLILATARRLTEAEAWLRAGEWKGWALKQFLGASVYGATLGILGMGRIGQAVARRARGFDMTVLYHNRHRLDASIERDANATYVGFEDLLARADILTLNVPYSAATHHLIGAAQLARMKPAAILINVARGGVVDDQALVAALRERRIAAAGLDVYENEPNFLPALLALKNVVLAPHIASSTEATRRKMAMTAAQNLVAALTGGKPPNLVNP